jgi:hypothetical protein
MLKERRTHPPMPLTLQPTSRNDDSSLDHISAEDCYLGNSVQHIERVPTELAQAWVEAYSATLKQVLSTVGGGDEAAITRALKWHLCIHHLLLRAPSSAAVGSRQWFGTLRRRFGNCPD